jgi:hypothetical protein
VVISVTEENMSNLGPKDATDKYEVPDDLSIPDFLRRAVAEASRLIAEMDKGELEIDGPELA